MKKKSSTFWIIIIAIFVLEVSVITDIYLRTSYHFEFKGVDFNNLTTPIIGLLSLIVYGATLWYLINQNKAIQSQNLRPYFEAEITRIMKLIKKDVKFSSGSFFVKYNGFNYIQKIQVFYDELSLNGDYIEDMIMQPAGVDIMYDSVKDKGYWHWVTFINHFAEGLGNRFQYFTLKELVKEIEESQLLDAEKTQLKKRIRRIFFEDYLRYVQLLNTVTFAPVLKIKYPKLAELTPTFNKRYIEVSNLKDNPFVNHYPWIKEKLM